MSSHRKQRKSERNATRKANRAARHEQTLGIVAAAIKREYTREGSEWPERIDAEIAAGNQFYAAVLGKETA